MKKMVMRFFEKCAEMILVINGFMYILSTLTDSEYRFDVIMCIVIPVICAIFGFEAERARRRTYTVK